VDIAIILVIILVLVLLWRGPQTLPRLGEAIGQAVRGARRAANDEETDRDGKTSTDERPQR
jgi:Sec-independent protein translocase protein TatA